MRRDRSTAKDALAGLVGGLAASWAMSKAMEAAVDLMRRELPAREVEWRMMATPGGRKPTEKAAALVAERIAGRPLTREERQKADPLVHYAMGALLGVGYGAAAGAVPAVTAGAGLIYGTAVWLFADLVALPRLRLSRRASDYPASTHALGLGGHIVYALVLEGVRRGILTAW